MQRFQVPVNGYCGIVPGTVWNRPPVSSEFTLEQVQVVIRHGDRVQYAAGCWPHITEFFECALTAESIPDPVPNQSSRSTPPRLYRLEFIQGRNALPKSNCHIGQLTKHGYEQQITNGQNMRRYYVDSGFLSSTPNSKEFYLRTGDQQRLRQSAEAFFLGMYPSQSHSPGDIDLVNLHTMDKVYDDIVENPVLCPRLAQNHAEWKQSPAYLEHYNTVTLPLENELRKVLGEPRNGSFDMWETHDCGRVYTCHNKSLPYSQSLFERINTDWTWHVTQMYRYPNVTFHAQLGMGFLMQEIGAVMMDSQKPKFTLYSAHDTTIMPILTALGVFDGVWTPYASTLSFEVYSDRNAQKFVRLLYNDNVLRMPGCGNVDLCSMFDFQKIIASVKPNPAFCKPL